MKNPSTHPYPLSTKREMDAHISLKRRLPVLPSIERPGSDLFFCFVFFLISGPVGVLHVPCFMCRSSRDQCYGGG